MSSYLPSIRIRISAQKSSLRTRETGARYEQAHINLHLCKFTMTLIPKRLHDTLKRSRTNGSLILEGTWSPYIHEPVYSSDDDDTSSISSHSTNATVDDNPGPGRLVDKYLYQRGGRRLEYFIFRIKLPSLPPARISRYIEDQYGASLLLRFEDDIGVPLSNLTKLICFDSRGSTTLSGLKSLVQQTKSKSVYRSSAALASLLRMSLLLDAFAAFYVAVSKSEPIFCVESLTSSLRISETEKRYSLFLVKLAEANVLSLNLRGATTELGHELRIRLSHLLDRSRLPGNDLLSSVGDACFIFAHAISCIHRSTRPSVKHVHIMKTVYYCAIFFFQSISVLSRQLDSLELKAQQYAHMVISTLSRWVDAGLCACYDLGLSISRQSIAILEMEFCLLGLFHAYPMSKTLLPSYHNVIVRDSNLAHVVKHLPRNAQAAITGRYEGSPLFRDCIGRSVRRAASLISSSDELHWEVCDSTVPSDMRKEPIETRFPTEETYGDYTKPPFHQLRQARRAHVSENELTLKFRNAREETPDYKGGEITKQGWDAANWRVYKLNCIWKNRNAAYFRSIMDWDWDLAGSLKGLFEPDESTPSGEAKLVTVYAATENVNGIQSGVWNVVTEMMQAELPREVRIQYRTESGEIKHMTYDCRPIPCVAP